MLNTEIYLQEGILKNKPLLHFHYLYWFKLIKRQYAPDSPIVTVQNKIDLTDKEFIGKFHMHEYSINNQYQISLEKTAKNEEPYARKYSDFEADFKELVSNYIKNKAHSGESAGVIQRYIVSIRSELRNWSEDYITFDEFINRAHVAAKKGGDDVDEFETNSLKSAS